MVDTEQIRTLFNEKKYDECKVLLKDEERNEDALIQYILASIANLDKDYKVAFIHFMNAASKGHNEAERALGIYYYQGFGCTKDTRKGMYWVKKAIKDGNVRAYCTLAHVYMNGIGVKPDLERGFKLYKCAADLGDEHALEHLVECYEKGIGAPVDLEKAYEIKMRLTK